MTTTRRIVIDPITRLEGHGKVEILLDEQGEVANAWLQVPELRGFERFCVGRAAEEMPQLTAHVCGVCPAAHHLASVRALDAMYRVAPPDAARLLQHAYYNLFIFEDHLLHYWYMGGPDLVLGPDAPAPVRNVLGVMAAVGASLGGASSPSARRRATSWRSSPAGPSTRSSACPAASPGGSRRRGSPRSGPRRRGSSPSPGTPWSPSAARWWRTAAGGRSSRTRPTGCGRAPWGWSTRTGASPSWTGPSGSSIPPAGRPPASPRRDYLDHVAERVEPWSYAKFTYLKARGWTGFTEGDESGLYRVGPLARLAVAREMATPLAEQER